MSRLLFVSNPLVKNYIVSTYEKTAVYKKSHLLARIYDCHFMKAVKLNIICVRNDRNFMLWSAKIHFVYNIFNQNYGFSKRPVGQRMIHTTKNVCLKNVNKNKKFPETPNILYYQSPIVWLKNKWQMRKLRNTWDPEFDQNEFTRGAKQVLYSILLY